MVTSFHTDGSLCVFVVFLVIVMYAQGRELLLIASYEARFVAAVPVRFHYVDSVGW